MEKLKKYCIIQGVSLGNVLSVAVNAHQRHSDDFIAVLGQEAFRVLLDKHVFLDLEQM